MTVMIRRLFKTGNSLAVSIPAAVRHGLGLQRGDLLALWIEGNGTMVLRKMTEAEVQGRKVDPDSRTPAGKGKGKRRGG